MVDIGENLNAHYVFYDILQPERSLGTYCITEVMRIAQELEKETLLGPQPQLPQSQIQVSLFARRPLRRSRRFSRNRGFCFTGKKISARGSPKYSRRVGLIVQVPWPKNGLGHQPNPTTGRLSGYSPETQVFYRAKSEDCVLPNLADLPENTPDAVHIATPHHLHFRDSRIALKQNLCTRRETRLLRTPE